MVGPDPSPLALLLGTSAIVATWAAAFCVFAGLGLGLRRLLGARGVSSDGLLASFWLGFGLVLLLLQPWNLLWPVGAPALALVVFLGLAGFVAARPTWPGRPTRGDVVTGLLALLLVVWVADNSLGPVTANDTGIYHLPSVIWTERYPIVPGLANLHGRLGFNNASLLYVALLGVGPWAGRAAHLANGLLLAVVLVTILLQLGRLARGAGDPRLAVFHGVLLIPVLLLIGDPYFVSSLTVDVAVAALLLTALGWLYARLVRGSGGDEGEDRAELVGITLLATAAVCVKLSAACVAGLVWVVAVGHWWLVRGGAPAGARARTLGWVLGLSAALALPWAARGVMLSGYPAYPSAALPFPVDWRVPREQVDAERDYIHHFAVVNYRHFSEQGHGEFSPGWAWFGPWLRGTLNTTEGRWHLVYPFALAAAALLTLLPRRRARPSAAGWWLLLPLVLGTGFWLVTAPRVVFGLFLFWPLAALSAAQAMLVEPAGLVRRGALLALVLLALLPLVVRAAREARASGRSVLAQLVENVTVGPGSDGGLHPLPEPVLAPYTTASGLELAVPQGSDKCFAAAPLCTPHPARNLRLRRPGDPGAGFAVDGGWQVERWPTWRSHFLESWRAVQARLHPAVASPVAP